MPKYPDIEVQLIGEDGNAFAIIGSVNKALRSAGIEDVERKAFMAEATSGGYDQVLDAAMRWVSVA